MTWSFTMSAKRPLSGNNRFWWFVTFLLNNQSFERFILIHDHTFLLFFLCSHGKAFVNERLGFHSHDLSLNFNKTLIKSQYEHFQPFLQNNISSFSDVIILTPQLSELGIICANRFLSLVRVSNLLLQNETRGPFETNNLSFNLSQRILTFFTYKKVGDNSGLIPLRIHECINGPMHY